MAQKLNEAHRDAILEDAQDALIVTDPDGAVLYMNDAAAHLYGFGERTGDQLESLNLHRYALETFEVRTLAGEPVPEDDEPLARVLRGEAYQNVELLVRHLEKDETRVFVFSGRTIDTDPPIGVLTIRDETDRWKAERRYRTAFETDPAPTLIARLEDGQILRANMGMQEILDSDKGDIVGTSLSELELFSQNGDLAESLNTLRPGERIHKRKTTLKRAGDGKLIDLLVSARAIEIDGEPCGIFTFLDVTELEKSQRANAELLAREIRARKHAEATRERLESVLEQAPELMATLEGPEHIFTMANQAYRDFFAGRDIIGRRVIDTMPEVEAQGIIAILDNVYQTGETFSSKEMSIDLNRHGTGHFERHYFNLVYQPLRDTDGQIIGILFNAMNITEQVEGRKRAESMRAEMEATYEQTIEGWARALDLRDHETAGHSQRVTDTTVALAKHFGMTGDELEAVYRGALLHDIGKMGIPDAILLKEGPLTPEEWNLMKGHTVYGRDLLTPIAFLESSIEIPYSHHEKWDGTGYPRGLQGEDIPLAARIFAVVDVYDALMSDRPYRDAWPRERVLEHLRHEAGSHFDPSVVDVFLHMLSNQTVIGTHEQSKEMKAIREDFNLQTSSGLLSELDDLTPQAVDYTVAEIYARHPHLLERFGPRGRQVCRQDTEHHLEYLAAAIGANTSQPFTAYIRWLKTLLEARHVPSGSLRDSLSVLSDFFTEHASPDLARTTNRILSHAERAFDSSNDSPPLPLLHTPEPILRLEGLVSTLIRGQHNDVLDLVRGVTDDVDHYADVAVHIIQPAMYEIGRLWLEGQVSVAQEHLATATSVHVLGELFAEQEFAEPTSKTALVACVETNHHMLGALMFSDALMISGWNVEFLGANTPTRDLVKHVDQTRPDLVALSVSMPQQLEKTRQVIEQARTEMGTSTPTIMVGGLAINQMEGIWKRFGADIWAPDVKLALAEVS